MQSKIISHPMLQNAEDIASICKPLKQLNISYFCHVKVTKSGEFSALANNPGFAEHYLTNNYYDVDIHLANSKKLGRYILGDEIVRSGITEKMMMEAAQFGVRHTFTIVKEGKDENNYYHFANHLNSQSINQVYLTNIDLLELFIEYFNETIRQSHLNRAHDIKFVIDPNAKGYTIKSNPNLNNIHDKRISFLEHISFNHLKNIKALNTITLDTYSISPRERQCLEWLICGKTAPEIAILLDISKRTVEKHLLHIKQKLDCQTLFELGFKLKSLFSQKD